MAEADAHPPRRRLAWRIAAISLLAPLVGLAAVLLLRSGRDSGEGPAPSDDGSAGSSDPALLRKLMSPEERMAEVQRIVATRQRDAVPALTQFARQRGDVEFRLACLRALGELGDVPAAQGMLFLAASQAESQEIRVAAIAALGAMGNDIGLPHLSRVLDEQAEPLRLAAVQALARNDSAQAAGMLGKVLLDEDAGVRAAAIAALAGKTRAEATEQLIAALKSPDAHVRLAAVTGLSRREGPHVNAALARAASDLDSAVRAAAAQAIRGADAAALDAIVAGANAQATVAGRLEIAQAIHRRADVKHAVALLKLLDGLRPRGEDAAAVQGLRNEVRDGLVAMGEKVLEPMLTAALDGELDALAEQTAGDVCRRLGPPAVAPVVSRILKWKLFPDPEELKMWIEVLGDVGDAAARPALNRALAQDIAGMTEIVATARAKIEKRTGAPLPACVPDAGILFEKPDLARAVVPSGPLAFHLPEHPDSNGLPADGVVRLVLARAVHQENSARITPDGERILDPARLTDLEIEIPRHGGAWQTDFIGYAPYLNKRSHFGRIVAQSRLPSGEVQLKIEMSLFSDQYVPGGYGEFELTFPADRAQFVGQYRGHFNYDPREGQVDGACWNVPAIKTDYPRVTAGEHPRMLFRKFQFEALREKARTDFGREVLRVLRRKLAAEKKLFQERVEWVTTWTPGQELAVGHGLLANLFDDPEHGRRAAALVIERTTTVPYGGEHGERVPGAWLTSPYAYDLAYAYFTPAEKAKANEFYGWFSDSRLFTASLGCMGNLAARGAYEVPGLTALSLIGEPGLFRWQEPPPPAPAFFFPGEARPAEESGAPLNDGAPNKMIAKWLVIGPFAPAPGASPLATLGKLEDLRAKPGLAVGTGEGRSAFRLLPAEYVRDAPSSGQKQQVLRLPAAAPGAIRYLYCEVQAERPQQGQLDWGHLSAREPSRFWLDGREMEPGTFVVLEPGRHRMLVEMTGSVVSPYLIGTNARRMIALEKRYVWQHAQWDEVRKRHAETGVMTDMDYSLDMCRYVFRDCIRRAAEETRATGKYERGSAMLAAAVRNALGEQLFVDTPLQATALTRACLPYLSAEELCMGLNLVPAHLQPALAHEFRRRYLPDKLGQLDCILLVAALVNYPLHIEPRPLPETDQRMIANRETFHVSFVRGGESDVQCQVALREEKSKLVGAGMPLPRAGALLLRGWGSDWITEGPAQRRPRYEAVLEVENAPDMGPCRVLDFQSDKSGSALLSLDMSSVYVREGGPPLEARRQVAVDYTGRSGAEALVVMLDRVRGKGKKTWALPVGVFGVEYAQQVQYAERFVGKKGYEWAIKTLPAPGPAPKNEFVLRREASDQRASPTVHGTILRPVEYEIEWVPTITKGTIAIMQVSAAADDVEFLVVLTLQKGAPPQVSYQAEGPNGVLTVGKQKVTIGGGRIAWPW